MAQGAIKLVDVTRVAPTRLPVVWMGACAVIPFVFFVVPRPLAVRGAPLQLSPDV